MKLEDADLMELIPNFMKEDKAVQGLSDGVSTLIQKLAGRIKLFRTWDQIGNMESEELDYLADELNVFWYDQSATVDVKRKIIQDAFKVHAKMGTAWAVEQVISTYFGEGEVIEWYEYGGDPGHFIIQTVNQNVLRDKYDSFIKVLNLVKRKSTQLDAIELISDAQGNIYTYVATAVFDTITSVVAR